MTTASTLAGSVTVPSPVEHETSGHSITVVKRVLNFGVVAGRSFPVVTLFPGTFTLNEIILYCPQREEITHVSRPELFGRVNRFEPGSNDRPRYVVELLKVKRRIVVTCLDALDRQT